MSRVPHSLSHLILLRLDCPCKFFKGHSAPPFCSDPKSQCQGNSQSQLSLLAIRTCPWGSLFLMDVASGTDHLCILHQCESLIFLLFGVIMAHNSICMNQHKAVCRRCFCFTSSLEFWTICITTVLPIQILVQHFSGGYSFSLVGLSGTWYDICETWNF